MQKQKLLKFRILLNSREEFNWNTQLNILPKCNHSLDPVNMVYSSKQQPTTPLLVVGHEISFSNGGGGGGGGASDGNSNNSHNRRAGSGNSASGAGRHHHQMGRDTGGVSGSGGLGGGGSAGAGGGSGYWNRSPVALNKSSNRYIDQSKAFIEDAYVKQSSNCVGRSPYYAHQQHPQAHGGGYYGINNSQPNSRSNSMTRPTTNRSIPAAAAPAMNDDDMSEVSGWSKG